MKTIAIDLDALTHYRISPNQYLFLWLTHTRQYAALYKYGQQGPGFRAEEITDLERRGLILNLNKAGNYYIDFFVLTDAVGYELFDVDRDAAALEFWNTYPLQLRDTLTGDVYSLLNTDKQRFLTDYYQRVGHSPAKHQRAMTALHYAIDKGMVDLSIRQWLESEQWTVIEEVRELATV